MGTIGLAGSRTRDGLPAGTVVPRTPRAVLVAAVLGTALAYMSDDMLNLAVPSVARDLGATMTDVQWILNAYYVPLVSFVLIAGSIGDIIGTGGCSAPASSSSRSVLSSAPSARPS